MEKRIFVEGMEEYAGKEITELFLLERISGVVKSGKKEYRELSLLDKTGKVKAYLYEGYMKPEYLTYQGKIVSIVGQVAIREKGQAQLYLSCIREEQEYDPDDYYNGLPPEEEKLYWEIIMQYCRLVRHEGYRRLLEDVFMVHGERIRKYPANIAGYNNYNGGILSHTVAVTGTAVYGAKIITRYSRTQKKVDLDLLVTAALLHEVGKIEGFTTFPMARRVDEGVLLAAPELAQCIISKTLQAQGSLLTKEEEYLLYHMIQMCSWEERTIKPMLIEAVILREAYQMQTRVEALGYFADANKKHREGSIYDGRLENYVYIRKSEVEEDGSQPGGK